MSNLQKRIELLSNLGIIVVAILLSIVLVNRYLLPATLKSEAVEGAQLKPGTKLSIPGVDWGRSKKTLLLVLSTNCRFCTEGAPFYQRLAQQKAKREDISLIAVMPQNINEAQKYLSDHGVAVDQIRQAAPGAVYVRATPTLIMVDTTGSIVESWVGKLPPEEEVKVSNRFLGELSGG